MAPDTTVLQQHRSTPPGTNRVEGRQQPHTHTTCKIINNVHWPRLKMQVIYGNNRTVHVVSQRSLQLGQRAAPGTELQQPQSQRHADGGHDQVGVVLRLGERPVQADGEAAVQLFHALLKAAATVASLRQPQAKEERSHRQETHVLGAAGGHTMQQAFWQTRACESQGERKAAEVREVKQT